MKKVQVDKCSLWWSFKMLTTLILATTTSSENTVCQFNHIYHFGDGFTDIGNSIHVDPNAVVPSAFPPYGITYPGSPTGRWSDGLTDFDYSAAAFGRPNIVPYMTMNSTDHDGVVFSVGRSPVLDRDYLESRGVTIPSYACPLSKQANWFKDYLKSVCSTPKECNDWLGDSLILMGDIEGNDVGYALTQGKTIQELRDFVPAIVDTTINTSREFIQLGVKLLIIPGNGPVGCYPYILTALRTDDPTAYDDLLCLKSVNDFIIWKNTQLQEAIDNLVKEFPYVTVFYGDVYNGLRTVIADASVIGPDGNSALRACCGIGGKYNYDSGRSCGSSGVPVCSNPNEYVHWDGLHFTQSASYRLEQLLVGGAMDSLNCTSQSLTASI